MKGKLPSLDPPHPLLFFSRLPLLPTILFFSQASSLFIWFHLILIDIHRDLCLCTSFLVRIAGGGAAPPPCTPPPLLFFNRFPLLPTILFVFHKHHRLFGFILSLLISIEICAYVLLSWYALRGEALRPPPAPPHPLLFLIDFPCYLLSFIFFIGIDRYRFFGFIFSFLIFIYIHRDLSLCASFLVRIAGGGAAPSPLHPPTRFYFLIDFPCYLLSFIFFIGIDRYRFFGFIFSFLSLFISIET